ncbi:MAG: tetratricopeptide repeat protein [Candidatus Heimdallarchaeota archaeon]|nr:tetratricopeptide repeat protein [Candidatus Heimdallarchaeota archaeon]MCK4955077.1 tetratricopeptide repeat protein [Candidatus Heimdallarchaeota archaeon]
MNGIFTKELEEIEQLIIIGKYNIAQERIDSIILNERANEKEKIRCKISKAQIHFETFPYSEVIKYGEEAFEESKKLNNKQLMFDSVIVLPIAYYRAGEYELRKEKIKLADKILDSFDDKESEEYLKRKAKLLVIKGDPSTSSLANIEESINISKRLGLDHQLVNSYRNLSTSYVWSGELKKAINYAQKTLELAERLEYFNEIDFSTAMLAVTHLHMGELDKALDYFLKSISICEETGDPYSFACNYMDLGYLYWLKRDLKTALNYYQKSLKSFKEAKIIGTRHYPWTLLRMNLVLIEMEKYEEALQNLEQIEILSLLKDEPIFKKIYYLAKAILLKTKQEENSWSEAITLLEEVAYDETVHLEVNGLVIFHLCDSYLKIIQRTNDTEVYEKLKNSIKYLKKIAEQQRSYILLSQSLLLQSKLELIEFNIKEGQLLLERAQSITEEKGIINLAKVISNEYDVLLDQLSKWEGMSTYLPSLEERFEFTHIEDILGKMIRNNFTFIDVVDEMESPNFFLIMNQDGSVLFSESLSEVSLEDELLQGILTTIDEYRNSEELSDEVIKRLKHRNYTIAINSQKDILIVYVFIGKSYHAMQKLKLIVEEFRSFTGEWYTYFEKIKDDVELSLDERMELSKYLESVFV